MEILSPLMSVRTLLSSMTEFMLSIHRVSTGPSNTIHFSSGVSSLVDDNYHSMTEKVPSTCHICLFIHIIFMNKYTLNCFINADLHRLLS